MTVQQWFARRRVVDPGGPRVVVFPDAFTNHLRTESGVACIEAIEAAGWQVMMPGGHVCCGRPLYDYDFLWAVEHYLRHVVDVMRGDIRAGTPIVGLEPSCLAVFKDELGATPAARRPRGTVGPQQHPSRRVPDRARH